VGHLRAHGFKATVHSVDDLGAVKVRHGIPPDLQTCHTAVVGAYVVEGHVPADLIARLLRERPAIAGLAVPGMPVGSPGMEAPGSPAERYQVLAFERGGQRRIFATR
jgi:hypothetical protein